MNAMRRAISVACLMLVAAATWTAISHSQPPRASAPAATVHRSPISLALSDDGRRVLATNATSGSVALIDTQSWEVLAECTCGRGPLDVAWLDNHTAVVSLVLDDALAILNVADRRLDLRSTMQIGDEPRGLTVVSPDCVWVALCGDDQIACVDVHQRKIQHRVSVGGHPQAVRVSPDKKWLVTSCSTPGEVLIHDVSAAGQVVSRQDIFDTAFNVGSPTVLPDSSAVLIPCLINRTFTVTANHIGKGWVLDNRLTRFPLPPGQRSDQQQLGLDVRGDAAGDVHAVAVSPHSDWMAITCSGSHELLLLNRKRIPWPPSDPGDVLLPELEADEQSFLRVELGGRPMDVEFIDAQHVLVANYLQDSLQLVDITSGKLVRTIKLGGPSTPSAQRRGAAIFYDADRSHHSWFSCHSCHTDGHTSGQIWDTVNDDSVDTYKLAPSLLGVTQTGPWTWHGWQTSLKDAMHKSMTDTLNSSQPLLPNEAQDLLAFLGALQPPSNPRRNPGGQLTPAAERGQRLFVGRGGCVDCHAPPHFTSPTTFDVGLGSFRDVFEGYNPPSLRGLHARRRFLHDGRATRLEDVLERHHRPERLGGQPLNRQERRDLIAYLQSL